MAFHRKPALPDWFGRRLSWLDQWRMWSQWKFRELPRTQAEDELASRDRLSETEKEDLTRLGLDGKPGT